MPGRKLELLVSNDGSDAATAVRLYGKLIAQDKVDLVLSPNSSLTTEAVADVTEKHKMPLVSGTPAASAGERNMSTKHHVIQELNSMSDADLAQVAEFLAFLKFRARRHATPSLDETQLTALYAEFAEEDRALAEEGMSDYASGLRQEDTQ